MTIAGMFQTKQYQLLDFGGGRRLERFGPLLYLLGLLLLVLVLIPGVGREVNGAVRWIPLGFITVQSAELMKLFMMLYLAGYLQRGDIFAATVEAFLA